MDNGKWFGRESLVCSAIINSPLCILHSPPVAAVVKDRWQRRLASVRTSVRRRRPMHLPLAEEGCLLPRYPVYVLTSGDAVHCWTGDLLRADRVPFVLVVTQEEVAAYQAYYEPGWLLVAPFARGEGWAARVRTWLKGQAEAGGWRRHWQLVDTIRRLRRRSDGGRRIPVRTGYALAVVEDFVERFTNVAAAGMNYQGFVPTGKMRKPFMANVQVYACSLYETFLPFGWRGSAHEELDYTLQLLASGLCTVMVNALVVERAEVEGDTPTLQRRYPDVDELVRRWPGVLTAKRKWLRDVPGVAWGWKHFDTPLHFRPDWDITQERTYGTELVLTAR